MVTPGDPRRRGIAEQRTVVHWRPWEASARGVDGAERKHVQGDKGREDEETGGKRADASAPLMTPLATLGRF